jgi:hypothetical protein
VKKEANLTPEKARTTRFRWLFGIITLHFSLGIRIFVPTGATGVTGATGPTGPTVTANNIRVATSIRQTVANGAPLNIGATQIVNGTAIQHPNGTDITLAPNQTYYAQYNVVGINNASGSTSAGLALNGTGIGGSGGTQFGTPGEQSNVSGGAVFNTGPGTNILTIFNTNNQSADATYDNATINVVKLA